MQGNKSSGLKLARPTGLEPATPRSTVWYSNQLSYGPTFCRGTLPPEAYAPTTVSFTSFAVCFQVIYYSIGEMSDSSLCESILSAYPTIISHVSLDKIFMGMGRNDRRAWGEFGGALRCNPQYLASDYRESLQTNYTYKEKFTYYRNCRKQKAVY